MFFFSKYDHLKSLSISLYMLGVLKMTCFSAFFQADFDRKGYARTSLLRDHLYLEALRAHPVNLCALPAISGWGEYYWTKDFHQQGS